MFLIDLRTARGNGCEIRPIPTMINHNTTEVFFDNLHIPADTLIGEAGKGFKYILDGMNAERVLIASEALGDGRYFVKRAVEYANERKVFDQPIGRNQGIQHPISRAYAELEAADMMIRKAAATFQAGEDCGEAANIAKMLASEAAWHAADTCFQTFGGFAFAREYHIERKWREVRLFQTAPISTNMILNFIAQNVLGLPRSASFGLGWAGSSTNRLEARPLAGRGQSVPARAGGASPGTGRAGAPRCCLALLASREVRERAHDRGSGRRERCPPPGPAAWSPGPCRPRAA